MFCGRFGSEVNGGLELIPASIAFPNVSDAAFV